MIASVLAALATDLAASRMCKWVDRQGSVHYGEQCPADVDGEWVELQAAPNPEQVDAAELRLEQAREATAGRDAGRLSSDGEAFEFAPREGRQFLSPDDVHCPKANRAAYVRKMEALCEQAREKHIAPLRQAEIEKCVRQEGRDREWCEIHFENFFNPVFPWYIEDSRVFDNLPECVIARTCKESAGLPNF